MKWPQISYLTKNIYIIEYTAWFIESLLYYRKCYSYVQFIFVNVNKHVNLKQIKINLVSQS